jgi:putative transposase
MPHHITQRGNRRQQVFFNDGDYAAYLELLAEWCGEHGVEIWSYCLMPNHIHLIATPSSEDGLRWAIGQTHQRYTRRINFREKWRGYLWQGRFASFVMDEPYLLAAARYIELNPVRARLVSLAADWRWSSARAHLCGQDDRVAKVAPLLGMVADWNAFLDSAVPEEELTELRRHVRTGRPLGDETFVGRLEEMVGRTLKPQKRGPKPKDRTN